MEIPVVNRIGEFDAGIPSLPAANSLSQIFASLSSLPAEGFSKSHHFLKWSALIIALLATFTGVLRRIKILILSFPSPTYPLSQPLFPHVLQEDDGFSGDETEDSLPSSCSDEEDDDEPASTSANWDRKDRDFDVRGRNFNMRKRFSWSDLAAGKSVVKMWENLRLDFDVDDSARNDQISIYDINKEQKIKSFVAGKSQISSFSGSPRSMVVSAEPERSGNLAVKLWDNRVECQIPAIITEWKPRLGKIVSVWSGGLHKLYVGDDVTGDVKVADVRSPLQSLTEEEIETWWDAAAAAATNFTD